MRPRGGLATIERLGWVTLAAEAILLATFFVAPAVEVTTLSFTPWEFSEVEPAHPLAGSSFGLFSSLGVLAIFAPLAIAFVRSPSARWLRVAPLAYALALGARLYAVHPSFGAYLFVFNAVVLATQVFYVPARASAP